MKKIEIHLAIPLSAIPACCSALLVHFFPKFSIYVRHKFNAV